MDHKMKVLTPDDDVAEVSKGGGLAAWGGNDTITMYADTSTSQFHVYGAQGEDLLIMDFTGTTDMFAHGHHLYGGPDSDTFEFRNLDNIPAGGVVVGRLEDFDYSQDVVTVNGVILDLQYLPNNVRIASFNGNHNDPGADPQQWILIRNNLGGYVFYSLEGARIDMNGDGFSRSVNEGHFIRPDNTDMPDFEALFESGSRSLIDPVNRLPAGIVADGGISYQDEDVDAEDVLTPIETGDDLDLRGGDVIAAGLNDDLVRTDAGDDQVWGGGGHDTIRGDDGDDIIAGNSGDDHLFGDVGDDMLSGGPGNDRIDGGKGSDLFFYDGSERIVVNLSTGVALGEGKDRLTGVEKARTGSGDDLLIGDEHRNILDSGSGNDRARGSLGNDEIRGGAGEDSLHGGHGDDLIVGGAGNDTVAGSAGNDEVRGGNGADILLGHSGNDVVDGGDGRDLVMGNKGNDMLTGGNGSDTLWGDEGSDTIDGGSGDDLLAGDVGADVFIFRAGSGSDVISDFSEEDLLDLDESLGITSAVDLGSVARQSGDDLVLEFGDGDQLVIEDITFSQLQNSIVL